MSNQVDWDEVRRLAVSEERPTDWPPDVSGISMKGIGLFGIDRNKRELYWDGQKLVTEKRFSTFERGLAVAGLLFAAIGVAATVVQAWFAAFPHLPPTP